MTSDAGTWCSSVRELTHLRGHSLAQLWLQAQSVAVFTLDPPYCQPLAPPFARSCWAAAAPAALALWPSQIPSSRSTGQRCCSMPSHTARRRQHCGCWPTPAAGKWLTGCFWRAAMHVCCMKCAACCLHGGFQIRVSPLQHACQQLLSPAAAGCAPSQPPTWQHTSTRCRATPLRCSGAEGAAGVLLLAWFAVVLP